MHGFLGLNQAVSLLDHKLLKCINVNDLFSIKHKLAYLIFLMSPVRGILFLREIKQAILQEGLIPLVGQHIDIEEGTLSHLIVRVLEALLKQDDD